jgi:epoxyqueuosine reductase
MSPSELTAKLKQRAVELGFELSGAAPAGRPPRYDAFLDWLQRGYAGEMGYLERRKTERGDPSAILPGVRSIFCVALSYQPTPEHSPLLERHPISCYAWGEDYHKVLGRKLEDLTRTLTRELAPGSRAKWYVDTGPILEREFAAQAGLGWIGKNTLLLNRDHGSFFFLGEILTDLELEYGEPVEDLCRTCTACMDACPTRALEEPGLLNANKCISYMTLEHRSGLPDGADLHGYLAGCDLCQTACPYNTHAPPGREEAFRPRPELLALTLDSAKNLDEAGFRRLTHDSALERIQYPMWRRNAAAGGGNPLTPTVL